MCVYFDSGSMTRLYPCVCVKLVYHSGTTKLNVLPSVLDCSDCVFILQDKFEDDSWSQILSSDHVSSSMDLAWLHADLDFCVVQNLFDLLWTGRILTHLATSHDFIKLQGSVRMSPVSVSWGYYRFRSTLFDFDSDTLKVQESQPYGTALSSFYSAILTTVYFVQLTN